MIMIPFRPRFGLKKNTKLVNSNGVKAASSQPKKVPEPEKVFSFINFPFTKKYVFSKPAGDSLTNSTILLKSRY